MCWSPLGEWDLGLGTPLFWQNVEWIREYVAAICSAVSILEAIASLGIQLLNVPVIASEPFSKLKI